MAFAKRDDKARQKAATAKWMLMERLATRSRISIAEDADRSGLPESTLRRYAVALQRRGLVDVQDSDILARFNPWHGTAVGHRLLQRRDIKLKLAEHIASDIEDLWDSSVVRSILVGTGTTAYYVARQMARVRHLQGVTVLTPSLLVADLLRHGQMPFALAGGVFSRDDAAFLGDDSGRALGRHHPDVAILGFSGMAGEDGNLYCTSREEAETLRACVDITQQYVYLACDTLAKVGRVDQEAFGCVKEMCSAAKAVWLYYPGRPDGKRPGGAIAGKKLPGGEAEEYLIQLGKNTGVKLSAVPVRTSRRGTK